MYRLLLLIVILFKLCSSAISQESTRTKIVPVHSVFTPLISSSKSECSLSCEGFKEIHLRTGYAGYDESAVEIPNLWVYDLNWKIVENPCDGTAVPESKSGCWVTDRPPYFDELPVDIDGLGLPYDEVKYLCPDLWFSECGMELGTYRYQTKFCLSTDAEGIVLNLKCLSDNTAKVWLNGELVADQGDISDGMVLANSIDISLIDDDLFILGENTLEIEVYNEGQERGVPEDVSDTGILVYLNVNTERGCVGCCSKRGTIWGVKYNDLNGDGILQDGEPPLAGVTLDLYSDAGYISSAITNELGYFAFSDLDPNTYKVVESTFGSWTCTYPVGSEYTELVIEDYSVISNLRFLNTEYSNPTPCENCGNSFAPTPNEKYWISAWVLVDYEEDAPKKTYYKELKGPYLRTIFLGTDEVIPEMFPTGEIIDGWQRIVGSFVVPHDAGNILLSMNADADYNTYFDDIRIHPFNGSMKSYVYDGETFWLTSELDDNNYATFYEYDEEGGLVRIKKETSRGIVTIQETRSNTLKKDDNAE